MAGMKSWLEKIKNRILKKVLDDDLLRSKIQSEEKIANEIANENELPDLITPTSEDIKTATEGRQKESEKQNEIQREEAIRLQAMYENKGIIKSELAQTQCVKGIDKDFVHLTDVPKRTRKT